MKLLFWLLLSISLCGFTQPPSSFHQAKKIAALIFVDYPETLYCHCAYSQHEIDLASCHMESAQTKARAHRLEWEHMMAAEHFGQQLPCWREPLCENRQGQGAHGRACCQKIDKRFQQMEAELYNLWPAVGLVNQARSNYRFGLVSEPEHYCGCAIKINKFQRKVEPDDKAKGIIARAHLFMATHYDLKLSLAQEQLFLAWNQQFPPSVWETLWAKQVALVEGYAQPYIASTGE